MNNFGQQQQIDLNNPQVDFQIYSPQHFANAPIQGLPLLPGAVRHFPLCMAALTNRLSEKARERGAKMYTYNLVMLDQGRFSQNSELTRNACMMANVMAGEDVDNPGRDPGSLAQSLAEDYSGSIIALVITSTPNLSQWLVNNGRIDIQQAAVAQRSKYEHNVQYVGGMFSNHRYTNPANARQQQQAPHQQPVGQYGGAPTQQTAPQVTGLYQGTNTPVQHVPVVNGPTGVHSSRYANIVASATANHEAQREQAQRVVDTRANELNDIIGDTASVNKYKQYTPDAREVPIQETTPAAAQAQQKDVTMSKDNYDKETDELIAINEYNLATKALRGDRSLWRPSLRIPYLPLPNLFKSDIRAAWDMYDPNIPKPTIILTPRTGISSNHFMEKAKHNLSPFNMAIVGNRGPERVIEGNRILAHGIEAMADSAEGVDVVGNATWLAEYGTTLYHTVLVENGDYMRAVETARQLFTYSSVAYEGLTKDPQRMLRLMVETSNSVTVGRHFLPYLTEYSKCPNVKSLLALMLDDVGSASSMVKSTDEEKAAIGRKLMSSFHLLDSILVKGINDYLQFELGLANTTIDSFVFDWEELLNFLGEKCGPSYMEHMRDMDGNWINKIMGEVVEAEFTDDVTEVLKTLNTYGYREDLETKERNVIGHAIRTFHNMDDSPKMVPMVTLQTLTRNIVSYFDMSPCEVGISISLANRNNCAVQMTEDEFPLLYQYLRSSVQDITSDDADRVFLAFADGSVYEVSPGAFGRGNIVMIARN